MPAQKSRRHVGCLVAFALILVAVLSLSPAWADAPDSAQKHTGYYRYPAIHGDTVVFTSEGDLWSVTLPGGQAHRLTSNTGVESMATISPDGKTVAFRAEYEGPAEVYTIPIDGGLPERRTWNGDARPVGWTPDGRILVDTTRYSTLPDPKLVLIGGDNQQEIVPLDGVAEAAYSPDGKTLVFTRWYKQTSNNKRYQGGGAENLWRFDGHSEATPLTADYAGASHNPMFWQGRVYFLSDRDGVMNLYSMDEAGHGVRQESHQKFFDIHTASLSAGRIVYSCGADLWLLDLKTGQESVVPITLESDFDQLREHWVKKPSEFLTSAHLAPDGSSVVFTARGEVFTLPAKPGRIVKVASDPLGRYREARFLPDGKSIVTLSTQVNSTRSGETEFWKFPANGISSPKDAPEQWTHDAAVLRWEGIPSPDGKWLAYRDKDQQLWILNIETKQTKRIAQSMEGDFADLTWSPDSKWLAYSETAANQFQQIKVFNLDSGAIEPLTTDRYNSGSPAWSADGKWLYFLSDRNLETTVRAPWGPRQPDPHFDRTMKIYELALTGGLRSKFLPADELHPDKPEPQKPEKLEPQTPGKDTPKKEEPTKKTEPKPSQPHSEPESEGTASNAAPSKADKDKSEAKTDPDKAEKGKKVEVKIDFADMAERLSQLPVPPGNYDALQATEKRLCWLSSGADGPRKSTLQCLEIGNKGEEPETVLKDVHGFEVSLDRKKILVGKGDDYLIVDAEIKASQASDPKAMAQATINLSRWTIHTNPREEFRGIFFDAWLLERDYYWDRHTVGIDWPAMRDRYLPLVDRVSDRNELNDVIAQMVSELSTLHTFVGGGDVRKPADQIDLAGLGAELRRDSKAGGFVVTHIYKNDPDLPDQASPLAKPDSRVLEGEILTSIDGESLLTVPDERVLLRGKAGTPVLLHVKATTGLERDVLVTPISLAAESRLRYAEWEYTRRLRVEAASKGQIGYVHLQAMGPADIDQWAREFYPVFNRPGLIVDVRHNHGGNIDSWLLGKLLRPAWSYWQPRVGNPSWNMQYAFRGHIVVLCDQETSSDGEAFAEGFRRLGLGKVLGTRTWGGEIWLSGDNFQADGGIATAAETGVYGPERKWLIEGHGVDPDVVVDNLPHATFSGSDQQLEAGLKLLEQEIEKDPRPVPQPPPYPDKSFPYPK